MNILAIETSCDETACAVVEDGVYEIASEVASSADLHKKTGGVVPEVAARKQVEYIVPVLDSTIRKTAAYYNIDPKEIKNKIDAIAVTVGPGLVGSLIVGIEAAKTLALVWNKPLIPVNHLIGHIYANFLVDADSWLFPAVVLIVSGGHTDLVLMKSHEDFEYLGGTVDDAAGEAFDKVARLLNYGTYLGGPALSKAAREYTGPPIQEKLPRPYLNNDNFDFSFSGLKTAVKRILEKNIYHPAAIAKEFEEAVVDVLTEKTLKAAKATKAKSILLGGGVSANTKLRQDLVEKSQKLFGESVKVKIPPLRLCTDNAVYIASAAYFNQKKVPLESIQPNPSLPII